jgi:hypothetical protein
LVACGAPRPDVPPRRPRPPVCLKEIPMKRMVAAIAVTLLVAASFVDIASAGWSW